MASSMALLEAATVGHPRPSFPSHRSRREEVGERYWEGLEGAWLSN